MPDFPVLQFPPLNVISPWSMEASAIGIAGPQNWMQACVSTAWGANLVQYHPFMIYQAATALKMSVYNGATATGNIDLGIYDDQNNRIVNSGSTAQTGTNTVQEVDIADTLLLPGKYYMAFTSSSGSATLFLTTQLDEFLLACLPVYRETTGGFGLPATATPALSTVTSPSFICIGVHFDALI